MSNQNKKISREYMHSIIPYIHCYEEGGMIEVAPDIYTKSFEIREPEVRAKEEYNSKFVEMVMKRILLNLTKTFSFQFVSYNSPIEKRDISKASASREYVQCGRGFVPRIE